MASPTYVGGPLGNVIPANTSLAASKRIVALLDLSTKISGAVNVVMATGGTAPTNGTIFALYRVSGATAAGNTTFTVAAGAASTTITVGSTVGFVPGQTLALISATTGLGEFVTVSTVTSSTTATITTTTNAYAINDKVFLVEMTPTGGSITPGSGWTLNSTYGTTLTPYAAFVWILSADNTDTAQAVTVSATVDTNPGIV